jgi:tRNA-dihydrouridine synthase A
MTREMMKQVNVPITVKCRLGVDDLDKYENLHNFIKIVSQEGGVQKFIIHARKCLLDGLNPHENRTVPQLKYDWVLRLKQDFPDLRFVINGGFKSIESIKEILNEEN